MNSKNRVNKHNMANVISVAKKCFQDEAEAILNLIPKLDDNFTKAIEPILSECLNLDDFDFEKEFGSLFE